MRQDWERNLRGRRRSWFLVLQKQKSRKQCHFLVLSFGVRSQRSWFFDLFAPEVRDSKGGTLACRAKAGLGIRNWQSKIQHRKYLLRPAFYLPLSCFGQPPTAFLSLPSRATPHRIALPGVKRRLTNITNVAFEKSRSATGQRLSTSWIWRRSWSPSRPRSTTPWAGF